VSYNACLDELAVDWARNTHFKNYSSTHKASTRPCKQFSKTTKERGSKGMLKTAKKKRNPKSGRLNEREIRINTMTQAYN